MSTHEALGARPALRSGGRRWGEEAIKGLLALCALVSVATTVGIVVALFVPAIEFFGEVGIGEFVVFWPASEQLEIFEHVTTKVIPALKQHEVPERNKRS